jgi:hypothetical protein
MGRVTMILEILERKEFVEAIRSWIASNPEEAASLLREALNYCNDLNVTNVTKEAQWAAHWARKFWAAAGVDPPRR